MQGYAQSQFGHVFRTRGQVRYSDTDVKHALTQAISEHGQVDLRTDHSRRAALAQKLSHHGLDRRWCLAGQTGQLVTKYRGRLVQREKERGAMLYATSCDRSAELDDACLDGLGSGPVKASEGIVGDPLEILHISPNQLENDGFLRIEVVIQAAGKYVAGVCDLLKGRPQPRGRE
jgi:hypothetical protein